MTPDRINTQTLDRSDLDERMTDLETLAKSVAAIIKAHCDRRIDEVRALIRP